MTTPGRALAAEAVEVGEAGRLVVAVAGGEDRSAAGCVAAGSPAEQLTSSTADAATTPRTPRMVSMVEINPKPSTAPNADVTSR